MDREQLAARSAALAYGARWRRASTVSVTAEAEANLIDQTPAASHAPWIKPIGDYERKETTIVEGLRYG